MSNAEATQLETHEHLVQTNCLKACHQSRHRPLTCQHSNSLSCLEGFEVSFAVRVSRMLADWALNHACRQIYAETLVYACVSCLKLASRSFFMKLQTKSHLKDAKEVMLLVRSLLCDPCASIKAALWPMGQRLRQWQIPPPPGSWVSKAFLDLLGYP